MKVITVHMEVPDEKADTAFQDILDACSDELISADRETLTIRVREPGTK